MASDCDPTQNTTEKNKKTPIPLLQVHQKGSIKVGKWDIDKISTMDSVLSERNRFESHCLLLLLSGDR